MAADALTVAVASPLDSAQVSKASSALLKHIASSEKPKAAVEATKKKSLLADEDAVSDSENEDDTEDVPVWLVLTTKKLVVDKNRLKPTKIVVPHSLHTKASERILLITAEPQRAYKDLIASPAFPASLKERIARVIDIKKLKAKYKSFEQKRQLAAEYDVVLADERIINFLPEALGKTFYKSSAKRPVPVSLTGKEKHEKLAEGKKRSKDTPRLVGSVSDVARDIEKALTSALVHLSPSVSTSIKIGFASWSPEKLSQNIDALVPAVVERCVPKKWNNVKSVHIKGPETAALPIYMTDELWVDEGDLRDESEVIQPFNEKKKKVKGTSKRPILEGEKKDSSVKAIEAPAKDAKKDKKRKVETVVGDDLEKEIAARKAKLKKQKKEAMGKGAAEL